LGTPPGLITQNNNPLQSAVKIVVNLEIKLDVHHPDSETEKTSEFKLPKRKNMKLKKIFMEHTVEHRGTHRGTHRVQRKLCETATTTK